VRDSNYKAWWDRLLASRNLLFIGVDESDISIRSYIIENISSRPHYVIAPETASSRLDILQHLGFHHVPYEVAVLEHDNYEDHSQLQILIESLIGLKPAEVIPPSAYEGAKGSIDALPNPEVLQSYPIEEARRLLNAAVASILPEKGDAQKQSLIEYDYLRRKYLISFASAAAVDPNSEYSVLHGYKIVSLIGEGAFGKVYLAEHPDNGSKVAIKVIHPQMISSGEHLNAFRRGAYAMRILTQRNVEGMVELKQAFEVPFSIVMEYVEGWDLENAIENRAINSFTLKLNVIRRVAEIVHSAHSIREQVLHRDLKPGNVLLKGYVYDDASPKDFVKLVDFDLCWHKYATAETIVHHKGSRGYAAPEMYDKKVGSTRRASVDVFSIGMLLYFLMTGKHPIPGMRENSSFEREFANIIRHRYKLQWTALGWFIARIVMISTNNTPSERCTLPDFIAMLDTAISLAKDKPYDTYLPILNMQIFEFVIGPESDVIINDYGRFIEYRRGAKIITSELYATPPGFSMDVLIQVTKDVGLDGKDHPKRDEKVRQRIEKELSEASCVYDWKADRSMREINISHKFKKVEYRELKVVAKAIKSSWEEIEKN